MHEKEKHPGPRVMALEVTRRCNLSCIHCRASSTEWSPEGEMSTDEYKILFKDVALISSPIILLSGGEPMLRDDIFEISLTASKLGLRVALSTNGTLITKDIVNQMVKPGINGASVSIDGPDQEIHDNFRKQTGAFEAALNSVRLLKDAGVRVQVNTSLTGSNMRYIDRIYRLVKDLDADAWHIFLLVPTGRGESIADNELIKDDDYEKILNNIYEKNRDDGMEIKPTCAPQYYRILRQRAKADNIPVDVAHFGINAMTRGCLAGTGFVFISYKGQVFPCGYYPSMAGDLKKQSFSTIWEESTLFKDLRNFKKYEGYCGACKYLKVCGGCRARALAITGNDFAPEPYCFYGKTK